MIFRRKTLDPSLEKDKFIKIFGENQSFSSEGLDTKNRSGKIKVYDTNIRTIRKIRIKFSISIIRMHSYICIALVIIMNQAGFY